MRSGNRMDFFSTMKAFKNTCKSFLLFSILFFLKGVQNDCFEYVDGIPTYTGTLNVTISGIPCQRWDVNTPHAPSYPMANEHENYCRNPDYHSAIWCYTTDPNLRWENCDIQECAGTTTESSVVTTTSLDLFTTEPMSSIPEDTQYCLCPCDVVSDFFVLYTNLSEEQKHLFLEAEKKRLRKELEVNTKLLSSHVRRKTSAEDNRKSSISMGVTSIVFLLVVFGVIVISDIPTLCRYLKSRWRTCKCKCKKKL